MRKFYMQKLVRDKIPQIIKENGGVVFTSKLEKQKFVTELVKKLGEEVSELMEVDINKTNEVLNEIADVEEIIDYLIKTLKISRVELKQKQKEKLVQVGGFKKRIFVETVVFEETNTKLIEYYRKKGWKEVEE